ncbi:MAG TPA: efflux RND transporter periplasmic adaptor subunit [Caulifigura sp.]|nr:efflux RND transporter periplasmic adaptor subunit [Caulifigura sp.]
MRRRSRLRRWIVSLGMVGLVGTGVLGGRSAMSNRIHEREGVEDRPVAALPGTTIAKRGPLSLVLSQRGMLDCVQKTTLYSRVEWETKLQFLLPEGAFVKKGDLVAELDVAKLREEYGDEQVDVMTAETALVSAQNALILQRLENENLLEAARLKHELADLSLEGYKAAEYPFQLRDLERQIAAAEDALHLAEQKYEFAARQQLKGYKQAAEVDRERLAVTQAKQKYDDLKESLRVLEKHSHERQLISLEGDAESSERGVGRTQSLAQQKLIAREMQINAMQRRLRQQKQQFNWATRMLKECEIRAPHDGQVVYASQRDSSEPMAEGVRVRFLQPIVTIPNRAQMQIAVRVHETQRRLLNLGLPAEIRTDADPQHPVAGKVTAISQFPLTGRYPNYDLREYEVKVLLDESQEHLTPGLTAKVDLIAASKADALQVPFEAVTEVDDSYLVFVRDGEDVETREVTLGERSQDHVEILAGLDEGELVVLDPRDNCCDEIAQWEKSRRDVLQTATALGE